MKITAEPRSDQWNSDDFVGGKAKVFTIADAKPGSAEQKYDIELAEGDGRVWRPPVTVLRILIDAWGDESDDWIGRRVALYREKSVRFGKEEVGGIRISHMSDLPTGDKPFTHRSSVSRGRKQDVIIKPLPPSYKPIPESFVAKVKAGGLSSEDQAKAVDYLAKLGESDPVEVAELRALLEDGGES
ncbi:hypothetical protein SEA_PHORBESPHLOWER_50 [Gordonia phage PhorbesPhlower]|nr:hypothetical protein SEA_PHORBESPHLOWER_50 [Gordonia phage PhorbesPhlower]